MANEKSWIVFNGPHNFKCIFQEYDKEKKAMSSCGCMAYGMTPKKEYLCQKHFDYARQMQGIPKEMVKVESVSAKKGK